MGSFGKTKEVPFGRKGRRKRARPQLFKLPPHSLSRGGAKKKKKLLNTSYTLNKEFGSKGGNAETPRTGRDLFQTVLLKVRNVKSGPVVVGCQQSPLLGGTFHSKVGRYTKQVKTPYLPLPPAVLSVVLGTHIRVNFSTTPSHTLIPNYVDVELAVESSPRLTTSMQYHRGVGHDHTTKLRASMSANSPDSRQFGMGDAA